MLHSNHILFPQPAFYNQKHAFTLHLLVKKVQADTIVPLADDIVAERGRVPTVACLFMISLLAKSLLSKTIPGWGLRTAVDGIIGIGSAIDAVVITIREVRLGFALPVGSAVDCQVALQLPWPMPRDVVISYRSPWW